MERLYSIDELKQIITPIAQKHGVKRVCVFGSYGRNEATNKSDVDLLIDKGKIRTLVHLYAFQLDAESALKKNVDLITSGTDNQEFLELIKPDEVLLYEQ